MVPLSFVMGLVGHGRGARHMTFANHGNAFGAMVGGKWWTASTTRGAPLPVKQVVRESLGCGELLLIATWELLKKGLVVFSRGSSVYEIKAQDVAALELGVAYYNSEGNTTGYEQEACRWMPWHEVPDTAEEWFELYKLPLPSEDSPNPELKRFLERDANGKVQFKPGGPGDLSPGYGGWSWYYVVRFLFEDSSPFGGVAKDHMVLICM